MRMVRAGESPSADAAAISAVVLNGMGAGTVRLRFSTVSTVALRWSRTASITA